ncbi:GNAT family N-acetyltransferase [Actinomadura sp. ATCC 31491]|uniref:GNAT family N-acetyltransferase n=1 Tax=Actinomadura luzonensis TaxID=2805427 RepID=A0ABT0FW59_9ACTN|nr:GNAT family N-acetyltransferase [Actinomadura luzonensis]MCK2216133.1 GNAT family N-acetyltransferase [Actinomadura luzonensis]
MNHDALLHLYESRFRREPRPDTPGAVIERTGGVVRQSGPPPCWNGVLWSDLDERTADGAIAEQVRHFGALGTAFEWKLYDHDRPADLGERLLAAGFAAEPPETLMIAETGRIAALPAPEPDGVRLVPVTDADGVELVAGVHERVFGAGRLAVRERLTEQLAEGDVVAVVAMAGDVPVSAARMDLYPGTEFAGLWGGGTEPEWRGRGVYRALVAYRARAAAALGYRYLQVDASGESRPILARLGFAALATTTPYTHP